MRIAFVTTNLRGGGAEKGILNLARLLTQRGHEVSLVVIEDRIEHEVPAGIDLVVAGPKGKAVSKGFIGKHVQTSRLKRKFEELTKAQGRFDLVVSTLPFADEIAIRADLPNHWCRIANTLSAELDALAEKSVKKAKRRYRRYRELYQGRNLIAVSQGVAEDLADRLGLDQAHIEIIPNPYEFGRLRQQASELQPDLPRERFAIHVGRFSRQKRHDVLFDAWSRIAEIDKLVLLTQPSEALSKMIADHGLTERVITPGFQSNPYPWIAAADVLVLSSDREGMPNVLVEALSLGTPIASTDCPSGPAQLMAESMPQCLAPIGDGEALAEAIRQALNGELSSAGKVLEPFEANRVLDAYQALGAQ